MQCAWKYLKEATNIKDQHNYKYGHATQKRKKEKRQQDEHLTGITWRHHIHDALVLAACRGIHT